MLNHSCAHIGIYIQIKEALNEPIETDKLASLLSLVLLQAILSLCIYTVQQQCLFVRLWVEYRGNVNSGGWEMGVAD